MTASGKTTLETRRDEAGQLDEIVATGATLHLEQMGGNSWWMSIAAGGRVVHVTFTTPRTIISGRCEDVSDGRSTETGACASNASAAAACAMLASVQAFTPVCGGGMHGCKGGPQCQSDHK